MSAQIWYYIASKAQNCRWANVYGKAELVRIRKIRMSRQSLLLLIMVVVFSGYGVCTAATFQGLGYLTGGSCSEATAVSADGSVVVGTSCTASGVQAFRWTADEGIVGVPIPDGLTESWATDVSADANFVLGYGRISDSLPYGYEGLRWHISGQLDRIKTTGINVIAKGISGDGSMVVGTSWGTGITEEAFLWTAEADLCRLKDLHAEGVRSSAEAVSGDGLSVVGHRIYEGLPYRDCYRWNQSEVVGFDAHTANATSSDGSVVVGGLDNHDTALFEAYRWTKETGLSLLGTCLPNFHSRALAVSGDGSVVVGYVQNNSGFDEQKAFIWDQKHGMRLLQDVLEQDFGLDLSGWQLAEPWASWKATGISENGLTVVGVALNSQGQREAWRAVLCKRGDFQLDGIVNMYDFAVMASAWQSKPGDENWNAECDISEPNDFCIDAGDLSVLAGNWQ